MNLPFILVSQCQDLLLCQHIFWKKVKVRRKYRIPLTFSSFTAITLLTVGLLCQYSKPITLQKLKHELDRFWAVSPKWKFGPFLLIVLYTFWTYLATNYMLQIVGSPISTIMHPCPLHAKFYLQKGLLSDVILIDKTPLLHALSKNRQVRNFLCQTPTLVRSEEYSSFIAWKGWNVHSAGTVHRHSKCKLIYEQ